MPNKLNLGLLILAIGFTITNYPTYLVAQDNPTPKTDVQENYAPINLEELSPEISLTGSDPHDVAVAAFNPPMSELVEGPPLQETVCVQKQQQQATVLIARVNLPDTSVKAIHYRVDLVQERVNNTPQWRIVWAGRQYLCRLGRGAQDWSKELCL